MALERALRAEITAGNLAGKPVMSTDGKFRLVKVLGYGASSVVCKAHEAKLDRPIALKLFPGLADDAVARAVKREAQGLAKISHPNIVTVHDFGVLRLTPGDHCCFFVEMELGVPLREWLRDAAPGQDKILATFCSIGEGLAAIHAARFVYRDFKPENVVLVAGAPKIVDFGLALAAAVESEASGAPPRVVGTPAFMAPEALLGRQDARSDQFSFAAALWKALCGELPYDGLSRDPAVRGPFRAPKVELPAAVLQALQRALDPEPMRRFSSMEQLLAALRPSPVEQVRGTTNSSTTGRAPTLAHDIEATTELAASARPRRRRLAPLLAFPAVGLLSVGGALAAMGYWDDFASNEAESDGAVEESAPEVIPDPSPLPAMDPCPPVGSLIGSWNFRATAVWSDQVKLMGKVGRYTLDLSSNGTACGMQVELRKIGNDAIQYPAPRIDRQTVQLAASPPFTGAFGGRFKPKRAGATDADIVYDFSFIVDGDRLYGDFHATVGEKPKQLFSGLVEGVRATVPDTAALDKRMPCVAQCGARCFGAEATKGCRQACQADPWAESSCPAPDPTYAVSLPARNEFCEDATPLRGRWLFLARDRETQESSTYEVELAADGCQLRVAGARQLGSTSALKGGFSRAYTTGLWELSLSDDAGVKHTWSLVGRDPALGEFVAMRGQKKLASGVIAAYRRP